MTVVNHKCPLPVMSAHFRLTCYGGDLNPQGTYSSNLKLIPWRSRSHNGKEVVRVLVTLN